ncbi:glycosyl hydrolase family 28-related protein [Bradyrhizobium sp. SBR1B]|uniref:glycosyl hydrolase family 28-related protein n=1 Tax=Bradyrhizobium sp. SBR1B TaxID=2663836 RepID=UPI001606BF93|nr:glycosyl hydrolase family 28-related protein [Bradyrhizobium sp. SBR1B]MBB4375619.1 hypothetical protein [Bradyrhizobium sp. SBR1B]
MNFGLLPLVASPPLIRGRFDPIFANRDFGVRGDGFSDDSVQLQRFLDEGANRQAIIESASMDMVYTGQLYLRDNCKLIGNGATLTAHPGSNVGTTGLHVTDATWAGVGPTGVLIQDLIIKPQADLRRTNGALTGTGQAAAIYCIGTKDLVLRKIKVINPAGDGIYIGGNSSTGRLSQHFSVEDCYVENPGRNCYSLVGTYVGGFRNCTAFNANYGVAHGNISYGWDFEPDSANTLNSAVDCVSCKAMYNQVGFGENLALGVSSNCNWISCYTEGNSIGFYASGAGFGCRVIGGRVNGNTTNYSTISEKIASFP